jgi:hypothetical protein
MVGLWVDSESRVHAICYSVIYEGSQVVSQGKINELWRNGSKGYLRSTQQEQKEEPEYSFLLLLGPFLFIQGQL